MGNFMYKLREFMAKKYGMDELNRALSIAVIVCIILSFIGYAWYPLRYFSYLGFVLIIFELFRCYSSNHAARLKERAAYLKFKAKITGFFKIKKRQWDERSTHVFYKCPSCKTMIRVPKGKGKIEISCPKCRTKFIKTT